MEKMKPCEDEKTTENEDENKNEDESVKEQNEPELENISLHRNKSSRHTNSREYYRYSLK